MRPRHHLLLTALLALTFALVAAAPAAAHTGFESSDPADGATVDQPVETVRLVFTGPAEPTGTGFQALDTTGEIREPTEATSLDGSTWILRFDPPLGEGAIGVRWMVKAPDAHPIDGSFAFTVALPVVAATSTTAVPAPVDAAADAPVEDTDTDLEAFLDAGGDATAGAERVGAIARVLVLAGTLVGVGALVLGAIVLRGADRDLRHVLHWVRRAGVVVVVGAVLELAAQIAIEGGGSWSALWSRSAVEAVLVSSFGIAVALRIFGGALLVFGARCDITDASEVPDPVVALKDLVPVGAGAGVPRSNLHGSGSADEVAAAGTEPFVHDGDRAWHPTAGFVGAVVGAGALVVAHLFDGHTVTKGPRLVTAVVDLVHVTGAAVWFGGVFMLATILWRRHREGRELRALQLAIRFSVVATVALVAVGVAGLGLTVIVLDSPSELWTTDWGRTLLAKTAFVGVAAGAGAYNHWVLIPRLEEVPEDPELGDRFRAIVTGEAIALGAVLVATALLMGAAS